MFHSALSDAILKHELSSENKAVECPELTKIAAHRDTVSTFVPEHKIETLQVDTGTVPEF